MHGARLRARVARRKNLELRARVSRFALCPGNPPVLEAKKFTQRSRHRHHFGVAFTGLSHQASEDCLI